uniref:Uncharacterized protein n=1 Tax=Graphocephala atropunctata TaxID=36148 RepID=A0A1B6KUI7_9HEMI
MAKLLLVGAVLCLTILVPSAVPVPVRARRGVDLVGIKKLKSMSNLNTGGPIPPVFDGEGSGPLGNIGGSVSGIRGEEGTLGRIDHMLTGTGRRRGWQSKN